MKILEAMSNEGRAGSPLPADCSHGGAHGVTRPTSAFTMVEIAICLAIIGIALVAIIGVLPLGMNVQRDNREATVVNQDATVFIEAIRNGARGMDDLTNYVYAITNYWYFTNANTHATGTGIDGYDLSGSQITKISSPPFFPITNGLRIVGLLSTPLFTDLNFNPADNIFNGGYSNHIVVYVHSLSGPAVEKPPQNNDILRGDSFSYRIICENAPVANYIPPLWLASSYNAGDRVSYILNGQTTYWQATATTSGIDQPNSSILWTRVLYPQELANNLHELRLSFLWPVQPNGGVGKGRQTFRSLVAGQIAHVVTNSVDLYFFQSQSFTNAP